MNRKNIIYAGRLFILLLIISYVLDKVIYYGINHIAKEVYSGQSVGKFNQYIGIKDSLDFIVYGNSRANHHINPSLITERGFNMGFDGQKIAFSATLLKLLPTKKQTLLFHIDPESAVDDDYMADDLSSLKVMYNKNEKVKKEIDRYKKLNPLQRFYWCISYNGIMFGIIKNYLSPNYEHTNYNGYDPLQVNRSQKTSQLGVNERNLNNNCEKRLLRLNPVYKSYLFDLREFCAINEKQIIFLLLLNFLIVVNQIIYFLRMKCEK
nr:hypothetical protein [Zobellia laminariae]